MSLQTTSSTTTNTACLSKKKQAPSIDTQFKLPSPLPSWPPGGGFATGTIDLGGLEVRQVSTLTKVWSVNEGGSDDQGATFFTPSPIPTGYSMLGSYAQPNNKPLFGWVLVARDTCTGTLAKPVDYTLIWSSETSSSIKQDGRGYFWLPVAPQGYRPVGHIVTSSPAKPALDQVRCVRADFTEECENNGWMWGGDINIYGLRPATRGIQARGVVVGTFTVQSNGSSTSTAMACLKNNKCSNLSFCMPNLGQIKALVQAYSPRVYFHPDEDYLPSSVDWFFRNGALLYQKDNPNPTPIDLTGSNLPTGGGNDGAYWLDLPAGDAEKEKVKRGDLPSAEAYIHIKPMLGATFTDIAVWFFYPFNGPAKAKVSFFNLSLGKIGEHVGDWEHVTLRVSNFTGELWRVFFSEHSSGAWVDASQLEFEDGKNKPAVYAALHGHGFYPKAGLVLQGNSKIGIGVRNDTAKGKSSMDAGARFEIVAAEHLGKVVAEPPWLSYMREWGPKISYNVANELKSVERLLPKRLRTALENLVKSLPEEVLGEQGPTGPKVKDSWSLDEKAAT